MKKIKDKDKDIKIGDFLYMEGSSEKGSWLINVEEFVKDEKRILWWWLGNPKTKKSPLDRLLKNKLDKGDCILKLIDWEAFKIWKLNKEEINKLNKVLILKAL